MHNWRHNSLHLVFPKGTIKALTLQSRLINFESVSLFLFNPSILSPLYFHGRQLTSMKIIIRPCWSINLNVLWLLHIRFSIDHQIISRWTKILSKIKTLEFLMWWSQLFLSKMMNNANGMMNPSSSSNSGAANTQSSTFLKTYFKTPEGRYKLQYEKTHPSGLLHYSPGKTVSQVHFSTFFFI